MFDLLASAAFVSVDIGVDVGEVAAGVVVLFGSAWALPVSWDIGDAGADAAARAETSVLACSILAKEADREA
ncbi:hypothetical protein ACWESM_12500 [Nocardia sp. NPDC003999]